MIFIASCTKDNLNLYNPLKPEFDEKNSNISVSIKNSHTSSREVSTIDVRGMFVDTKGNILDIDKLIVNGYVIEKLKDGEFYNHFNFIETENFHNVVEDFSRGTMKVTIIDDDLGTKEHAITTPKPVKMVLNEDQGKIINKNEPFKIYWPTNNITASSNRTVGNYFASVNYHSALLNQYNSNLPTANSSVSQIEDNSSGQITFTPNQLEPLPVDGKVIVYLGTGEQVTFDGDVSNNTLTYSTYSATGPMTISAVQ